MYETALTKTVEGKRSQRAGAWCEPAAYTSGTYHFRAGDPKAFGQVDVLRQPALRDRACQGLKRQPFRLQFEWYRGINSSPQNFEAGFFV